MTAARALQLHFCAVSQWFFRLPDVEIGLMAGVTRLQGMYDMIFYTQHIL
jgi:hypothetical protein